MLGSLAAEEQVWACDIDPSALTETFLATDLSPTHVWCADFLSLVDHDGVNGRRFDAIIGNPPFISLHRMGSLQRTTVRCALRRLKSPIDLKASLWAYFVVAGMRGIKKGGRMAMILPEAVLHSAYARGVLQNASASFGRCMLLSIRERLFLQMGAAERIVLFLADNFRANSSAKIELQECRDARTAEMLLRSERVADIDLPALNGHVVPHLIRGKGMLTVPLAEAKEGRAFSDFADVKIGVVTGDNSFFLLTELARLDLGVPISALVRICPKFVDCKGLMFNAAEWSRIRDEGKRCWLFRPQNNNHSKSVRDYLKLKTKEDLRTNVTFNKREPWFRPELGRTPDAFLQYMGTNGPRMALSSGYATCTNTIHRVYFKRNVSPLLRKAIVLSIHSSFSQLSAEFEGRSYGLGVLKLEPSEARRLRVLIPRTLKRADITKCFLEVDQAVAHGNRLLATRIVDEWLYRAIPALSRSLSLSAVRKTLVAATKRRLGALQLRKGESVAAT